MKKLILSSLFFCGIILFSKAQITVSGLPAALNANGVYSITATCPVSTDAGVPIFTKTGFIYILRQGGKWKIMDLAPDGGTTYITTFKLINNNSLNAAYPPCVNTWVEWTGLEYSDVPTPPVPFTQTGNIYTINMTSATNQCINTCFPQGSVLWPKVADLPTVSETDRNAITPAEGLRAGSMLWNCTTRKVNIFDGYMWKVIKSTPAGNSTLNSAGIGYTATVQRSSFTWTTTFPVAQIFSFKIQYSLNNSDWVDYRTFAPTVFADNSPTNNLFIQNNTYKFRLVTTTLGGDEYYSCTISTMVVPPVNFTGVFRSNLSEFDLGTAPQIEYKPWTSTPVTLNDLSYSLEKFNGTSWDVVAGETLAGPIRPVTLPTTFSLTLPLGKDYTFLTYTNYVLGGRYRVVSVSGSYQTIQEFTYKKIQPQCFENE